MTKLLASELIARRKAELIADNERMSRRPAGVSRAAWRAKHPIAYVSLPARDTAFKTLPKRLLAFDLNGQPYDLWVYAAGGKWRVIEHIDLSQPDADARLARYEFDAAR